MKILEIRHVEDCFDGSIIKEVLLNAPVTKELVYRLGTNGEVQYFAHFAKPFFKVRVTSEYDLKGIAGNDTIRVHLKRPDHFTMDDFTQRLEATSAAPGLEQS